MDATSSLREHSVALAADAIEVTFDGAFSAVAAHLTRRAQNSEPDLCWLG